MSKNKTLKPLKANIGDYVHRDQFLITKKDRSTLKVVYDELPEKEFVGVDEDWFQLRSTQVFPEKE